MKHIEQHKQQSSLSLLRAAIVSGLIFGGAVNSSCDQEDNDNNAEFCPVGYKLADGAIVGELTIQGSGCVNQKKRYDQDEVTYFAPQPIADTNGRVLVPEYCEPLEGVLDGVNNNNDINVDIDSLPRCGNPDDVVSVINSVVNAFAVALDDDSEAEQQTLPNFNSNAFPEQGSLFVSYLGGSTNVEVSGTQYNNRTDEILTTGLLIGGEPAQALSVVGHAAGTVSEQMATLEGPSSLPNAFLQLSTVTTADTLDPTNTVNVSMSILVGEYVDSTPVTINILNSIDLATRSNGNRVVVARALTGHQEDKTANQEACIIDINNQDANLLQNKVEDQLIKHFELYQN